MPDSEGYQRRGFGGDRRHRPARRDGGGMARRRLTIALVSTGRSDLFVVCKNCGAEVSPYITECPYCGKRLRKRAPKIDRDGRVIERTPHGRPTPSLTPLRRGEIPGIARERRPYVTSALVLLGVIGCLLWRTGAVGYSTVITAGAVGNQWWRPFTAPFVYSNTGYAFIALAAIALFGTLLERRAGPLLVIAAVLLAGAGGALLSAQITQSVAAGGNGIALAMLITWAMPDLLRLRKGHEFGGDLIGVAVFAVALVLMPLTTTEAGWVPCAAGIVVGILLGLPTAWLQEP
jgi:membrane associated rhomboid family serine protease/DNA-directed RNA polymerase subunit RPC12/RpoP